MLSGKRAGYVWFDESAANPVGGQYIGQLPGTVDGTRLPPAGAPDVFAEVDDPTSIPPTGTDAGFDLRLWRVPPPPAHPAPPPVRHTTRPTLPLSRPPLPPP